MQLQIELFGATFPACSKWMDEGRQREGFDERAAPPGFPHHAEGESSPLGRVDRRSSDCGRQHEGLRERSALLKVGAHGAARTTLNHGDSGGGGGGGDVRHLGFLSTGFPPIEAHKLWLRGRSGRVQYTRCSLFYIQKGERAQLRERDPLSPSRARAGAPDLSRPSLCPRRAQAVQSSEVQKTSS